MRFIPFIILLLPCVARAELNYLGYVQNNQQIEALIEVNGVQNLYAVDKQLAGLGIISHIEANAVTIRQQSGNEIVLRSTQFSISHKSTTPSSHLTQPLPSTFDEIIAQALTTDTTLDLASAGILGNFLNDYGLENGDRLIDTYEQAGNGRIIEVLRDGEPVTITIAPS